MAAIPKTLEDVSTIPLYSKRDVSDWSPYVQERFREVEAEIDFWEVSGGFDRGVSPLKETVQYLYSISESDFVNILRKDRRDGNGTADPLNIFVKTFEWYFREIGKDNTSFPKDSISMEGFCFSPDRQKVYRTFGNVDVGYDGSIQYRYLNGRRVPAAGMIVLEMDKNGRYRYVKNPFVRRSVREKIYSDLYAGGQSSWAVMSGFVNISRAQEEGFLKKKQLLKMSFPGDSKTNTPIPGKLTLDNAWLNDKHASHKGKDSWLNDSNPRNPKPQPKRKRGLFAIK